MKLVGGSKVELRVPVLQLHQRSKLTNNRVPPPLRNITVQVRKEPKIGSIVWFASVTKDPAFPPDCWVHLWPKGG